jgi:hypothetical protein
MELKELQWQRGAYCAATHGHMAALTMQFHNQQNI